MRQPVALIIDDCDVVREAMADTLAALGFETTTAADGFEGVEAFTRRQYDLVVTDLQMPRMDGREVTRRLRAARPDVAILVVSGTFFPETVDASWPTNRLAMLPKPFSLEELKAAVEHVTAGAADSPTRRAA